ncbi:MAG TPA: N-succinylglutamate 5-semialdehyde dehydrogenase, partial [Rhodopirellula sp.]|nr:N-succinylglutamate 5-semialdehyde dehydrogenase [Rhodopirellula sp.]
ALRAWRSKSIDERIAIVRRFGAELTARRTEVSTLISREVGKLAWDADGEVGAAIAKVEMSILARQQRASDVLVEARQPSPTMVQRKIRYQPVGVALVLGPFNFPLHLPGGQIIPALLAGNAIVFKPSEQAMAVAQWMVDAWCRAGLPRDVLQLLPGAAATAKLAIDAPEVSAVFLTGGRVAGHAIHRQLAGRPEVLLALELGGNNPIVIMESVDPEVAARIVSFSAFVSAGQRCTCARRAFFLDSAAADNQIDSLVNLARGLRSGVPFSAPAPQVGPLVSEAAASGVLQAYERMIALGCKSLLSPAVFQSCSALIGPAIVDATGIPSEAVSEMNEMEWFGPLLVLQRVDDFETALAAAAQTSYGLSAALLGGTEKLFEKFVDRVGAGVVNWNSPTTGAAGALPFGGLGASGNHRPAGFFAIDFCCDPVASLEQSIPVTADLWGVAK